MEIHLGRALSHDEIVHHKNGNKKDNRIENLMVLTNSSHAILHSQLKGYKQYRTNRCAICGTFIDNKANFCKTCAAIASRKVVLPPIEELQSMIDNNPLEEVARRLHISSNALRKWIKKLSLHYVPKKNKGNIKNLNSKQVQLKSRKGLIRFWQQHPYQFPIPIVKCDTNFERIKTYRSPKELVSEGFNYDVVRATARGKKKSYKGFLWFFENELDLRLVSSASRAAD